MKKNTNYYKNQDEFIKNRDKRINKYLILVASNSIISQKKCTDNMISIYGARFPHIIYDGKIYEEGLISIEICDDFRIDLIKDIRTHNINHEYYNHCNSLITILDGFCKDNEVFLSKLFENLNINTNIIGGGAGLLNDENKCIIFDNESSYRNCALLLSLKQKIYISARHGWEFLSGPFIATSSEKNLLKTIDYIPAFDYYKQIIKNDCGIEITKDNFFKVSQNYPLGIIKYHGEQIVRDPIDIIDDGLLLLGEISSNSMINILKGSNQNLLEASKEATFEYESKSSDITILFDCISRKNFLGEDFVLEINSIYENENKNKMIGVTTLGEIANSGNRYINFLNKTCVIGRLCS